MRYIITDLEATCWENTRNTNRMEIIEIGAVEMLSARGSNTREFSRFVRPVVEPQLSAFCKQLTSISQADVDQVEVAKNTVDHERDRKKQILGPQFAGDFGRE